MKFCQDHWDKLRKAIEDRGLGDLIASDGNVAMKRQVDQLQRANEDKETITLANYDPLMAAMWAIVNNAGEFARRAGGSSTALYLMTDGPEDPIQGYSGYEDRTWPRCPICYLNLAHEITCTNPECNLPRENGYDWFIDKAADEEQKHAAELKSQT